MDTLEYHRVASTSDLKDADVIEVELGDRIITIYRLDQNYYATDGICTHSYARLAGGYVEGELIECPYHGGTFDIRTGRAVGSPCTIDLKVYPVRVDGDAILIGVGE